MELKGKLGQSEWRAKEFLKCETFAITRHYGS